MADEKMVKIILPDGQEIDAPQGSEAEFRDALKDEYPEIENAQYIAHENSSTVEFRRVAAHKG